MHQFMNWIDESAIVPILVSVFAMCVIMGIVYSEGRQQGRIDVSAGQWQCEKFVDIRDVFWECNKNEN